MPFGRHPERPDFDTHLVVVVCSAHKETRCPSSTSRWAASPAKAYPRSARIPTSSSTLTTTSCFRHVRVVSCVVSRVCVTCVWVGGCVCVCVCVCVSGWVGCNCPSACVCLKPSQRVAETEMGRQSWIQERIHPVPRPATLHQPTNGLAVVSQRSPPPLHLLRPFPLPLAADRDGRRPGPRV